uniref:SET domain-containing protein n=1 Tax=Gongylonema pulchrum TaxID=637853 RepID=A0A183EBR3_9BILA
LQHALYFRVWQHGVCVGIGKKNVPDIYKCEECEPRSMKLTREEAHKIQLKNLARQQRENARKQRIKQKVKQRKSSVVVGMGKSAKTFVTDFKYTYSRSVTVFSRGHEDTVRFMNCFCLHSVLLSGDASALETLRKADGISLMFVAHNIQGLVATRVFHPDEPVLYFCGRISLASECSGRDEGMVLPFVILYSDLVIDGTDERISVCVDARQFGSIARFARRSCRPNIKLQHLFVQNHLHIIGVAAHRIESAVELTVPFDGDYVMSKTKLICSCHDDECGVANECIIERFNRSLELKQDSEKSEAKREQQLLPVSQDESSSQEEHTGEVAAELPKEEIVETVKRRNEANFKRESGEREKSATELQTRKRTVSFADELDGKNVDISAAEKLPSKRMRTTAETEAANSAAPANQSKPMFPVIGRPACRMTFG